MLTGTLIGSILGNLAKHGFRLQNLDLYSLVTSMIFGFITGIILMRKKYVQQFITIEDIGEDY